MVLIIINRHLFLSRYSLTEIKENPGQTSQRSPSNKEKASPNVCLSIYICRKYNFFHKE